MILQIQGVFKSDTLVCSKFLLQLRTIYEINKERKNLANSNIFACFSGAVGARLSTDASTVRSLVGDALALLVQNIATVTAGLVIAFVANWKLAFIILAVSPLQLIQGTMQTKFMKGFSADAKVSFLDIVCIF